MMQNIYPLEKLFGRIISPFDQFLQRTTAGGLVLMGTTVITLTLANISLGPALHHLWEVPLCFGIGNHTLTSPVQKRSFEVIYKEERSAAAADSDLGNSQNGSAPSGHTPQTGLG